MITGENVQLSIRIWIAVLFDFLDILDNRLNDLSFDTVRPGVGRRHRFHGQPHPPGATWDLSRPVIRSLHRGTVTVISWNRVRLSSIQYNIRQEEIEVLNKGRTLNT